MSGNSGAVEAPVEQPVGQLAPERDHEDPADPSVHEPVGCKTPSGCSEHGCRGDCLGEEDPKCDRCGAPITTAMMSLICPHGRQCGFVVDEDHWQGVEALRVELGIERVKTPNVAVTGPLQRE